MYSSYGRLIGIRRELVIRRLLSTREATALLGVETDATKKELKVAYLKKAKLYHPDNGDTGSETMFRKVHEAHDKLVLQLDQPRNESKSEKKPKDKGGYQSYYQYRHMNMAQNQYERAREQARREHHRQRQYHVDHQRYYAQRKLQFAVLHFIYVFVVTIVMGYMFISAVNLEEKSGLYNRTEQEDQFVAEMRHVRQSFRTVARVKKMSVTAVYVEYVHYVDRTPLNRRKKLSTEDYVFLDRSFMGGDPRAKRFVLSHPDYILNDRLPNSYKSLRI